MFKNLVGDRAGKAKIRGRIIMERNGRKIGRAKTMKARTLAACWNLPLEMHCFTSLTSMAGLVSTLIIH